MPTVTRTTVDVKIGRYRYRADVDGNLVELFRDGVAAGSARWNGGRIDDFPDNLSEDARDALNEAIRANLAKAWRARTGALAHDDELLFNPPPSSRPSVQPKTQDASNHGQMGNELNKPARQGEAEVGAGGPGYDPDTGLIGGQKLKPREG